MAGTTIGSRLVGLGHEVRLGSRAPGGERSTAWVAEAGDGASEGALADAAAFGEVVVNCTAGAGSLEALSAAGEENLAGKVLIDVANPLDFTRGPQPTLSVCNDDSLGERIQRVIDLGGITASRATEATIFLWLRIADVVGSYHFNFEIAHVREDVSQLRRRERV